MLRLATVVFLLFAGCGGEVRKSEATDGATAGAGSQSGQPPGGGTGLAGTALPACSRGFKPDDQTQRPCDFLADGLCYAEKVDACACVCPNRAGTSCTSGFPVPNGRVVVTCQ